VVTTGSLYLETRDSFCTACHLRPEQLYFERSLTATPVDLASAHAVVPDGRIRCIDCHAGPSLSDRTRSLPLAAQDALSFVLGTYDIDGDEFAPLDETVHPPTDQACSACHTDTLSRDEFGNHFHFLLADPEAPPELACVGCHLSHEITRGEPFFTFAEHGLPTCNACHRTMGGPQIPVPPSTEPPARTSLVRARDGY
jgi:hypothetical protein